MLAELCIQYASVGEAHLPLLATACNDNDMLVRRQALSIVTSLLRADYAKWRPGMFVWFARATAHEDESTRQQAKGLIRDVLQQKFPNLVYNNFIDVMKVGCLHVLKPHTFVLVINPAFSSCYVCCFTDSDWSNKNQRIRFRWDGIRPFVAGRRR